jgi:hypothetical protein
VAGVFVRGGSAHEYRPGPQCLAARRLAGPPTPPGPSRRATSARRWRRWVASPPLDLADARSQFAPETLLLVMSGPIPIPAGWTWMASMSAESRALG